MSTVTYKIPTSVLVVIVNPDNEFLLIERARYPGFWQSVTGSLDAIDEPLEKAAQREVYEEIGIVVGQKFNDFPVGIRTFSVNTLINLRHQTCYDIMPEWRHRYAPDVAFNHEHWFVLYCVETRPKVVLSPHEHCAYRWLPTLQAAQRCFSPSNQAAILKVQTLFESVKKL